MGRKITVLLLAAVGGIAQPSGPTEGVVEFHVTDRFLKPPTDSFGRPVAYRCASFRTGNRTVDVTNRFSGLRGEGIPIGFFKYLLTPKDSGTGAPDIFGDIRVSGTHNEFTVTADVFA